MISRKVLKTDAIKMFVLDEADEMLSRGFKVQIVTRFVHFLILYKYPQLW